MSFWYGFDVGSLPVTRQLGLELNLERVQAQQQIRQGLYDSEDWEAVKDLFLAAYDDEDIAQAAQLAAMKRTVRRETEAARQAGRPDGNAH